MMNSEDVAHYEGQLVMRVANTLCNMSTANHRSRRKAVEKAILIVRDLINDPEAMTRFVYLANRK